MFILFYLLIFCLGLIIGSFLNVIIYRLPKNISIINPRSFCPKCKQTIPFYRNIPVLTFLIQKGRCNQCKANISIQYPIVEMLMGFIFLFSYYNFFIIESLYFIIISSLLICIIIIDYKFFIIPFSLSFISLICIIIYIINFTYPMYHVYGLLIGVGYLSFIFIITFIITKKQPLGFGDLQLITILGLWLGPLKILLTIFSAAVLGIIYWIILSLIYGYKKDIKLPFGSFLGITSIIMYTIQINWDLFSNI